MRSADEKKRIFTAEKDGFAGAYYGGPAGCRRCPRARACLAMPVCQDLPQADGAGLYVAYSNLEYEAEGAPFTMTVNEAGQTVLTLTADDGTISWVKQEQ